MDLTPWAPLIASLGGVALGSMVAFVGQGLLRRQTSRLSYAERTLTLRDDRREVIYAFLDEIQKTEQMVNIDDDEAKRDVPENRKRITEDERYTRLHRLWFEQKRLRVVGSHELDLASESYTVTMRDLIWPNRPPDIWVHMDRDKQLFTDIARMELYSKALFHEKLAWWRFITKNRVKKEGDTKRELVSKLRYPTGDPTGTR